MLKPKSFLRVFTESGPLIVLAVAIALLVGDRRAGFRAVFQFRRTAAAAAATRLRSKAGSAAAAGSAATCSRRSSSRRRSGSRIIPRRRRRRSATPSPERNVLVLGDGMADWLAYGLEDAYAEQPDMGVIRRPRPFPA